MKKNDISLDYLHNYVIIDFSFIDYWDLYYAANERPPVDVVLEERMDRSH